MGKDGHVGTLFSLIFPSNTIIETGLQDGTLTKSGKRSPKELTPEESSLQTNIYPVRHNWYHDWQALTFQCPVFPQDLTYGYYNRNKTHGDPRKPLDWAIVEASAITEEGWIVPGASVGATPEILQSAEKIIIEVNTRIPNLEGLHDINHSFVPPHRQPYVRLHLVFCPSHQIIYPLQLIVHPQDRIGRTAIPIDTDRVVAIIESTEPDNTGQNAPETPESRLIASHLIEFLSSEVSADRLPKSLLPLQSGIGNVANSIIGGLADGPFEEVMVWTEVLQDTFIRFFDSGKLAFATATSIKFSPEG